MKKSTVFMTIVIIAMLFPMQQKSCRQAPIEIPDPPGDWDFLTPDGQAWKSVTVCWDSLKLPTEACPDIRDICFRYPEEIPTELCDLHIPKGPQLTYSVERLWEEFNRPIYLTTWLFPSLFISKLASWEGYKEFIDIMVENDYGNSLRVFAFGSWEGDWTHNLRFPFKKINGKFDLEQMDPEWLEETLRRIEYFVERGGAVIYTLIDKCSMYMNRAGFWNRHPWNGDNNINGTHEESKAVGYMYNWTERGIYGAKETKYYVLKFMKNMVRKLEKKFPDSIVYDFNEFNASPEWYLNVDRDVFQRFDIPRHRKMFSYTGRRLPGFPFGDVAEIMTKYIYQPHGICSLEAYQEIQIPGPGLIQPSADGCAPPASRSEAKWIVFNSLMDGRIGFENNRYWHKEWNVSEENLWKQADWNIAKGMKKGFLMWYEANK